MNNMKRLHGEESTEVCLMNKFSDCEITFYNLIINTFFACDEDIKLILGCLEPFRSGFYPFISVQHMEESILCIAVTQVKAFVLYVLYKGKSSFSTARYKTFQFFR